MALWQAEPGSGLSEGDLARLRLVAPHVIVLPEYFWVKSTDRGAAESAAHYEEDLRRLEALSREIDAVWVGGTLVEPDPSGRLYNTCVVADRGKKVLAYRKRRLMPGEAAGGLSAGAEQAFLEVRGLRLGLLVCADVFEAASWEGLRDLEPDVIAVPTNSPHREEDPVEEKFERDRRYFVEGARTTGAWVLKACTVGHVFGRPVQGRSLIAGPDGVLVRVPPAEEARKQLLSALIAV